jgi:predicted membrane channel-forming protein YqfA (hemolysin III family)
MTEKSKNNIKGSKKIAGSDKEVILEEGAKLYYDAMKHLTTLATGATLILVTFLEKLFTSPRWRALVAGTFISLIFSIIASFASMINFAHIVSRSGNLDKELSRTSEQVFYVSIVSFILGIICLVIFTLRNLF